MKNYYLHVLLLLSLFSSGCATSSMRLQVMKPADITVDRQIRSLTILNRTKPQNDFANGLEGFISGESPQQDRRAVEEVLTGLQNSMAQSDRFSLVRAAEYMTGSGSGHVFPDPLSWQDAEKLCSMYATDAVLAIETFDSDFMVENSTRQVDVKGKDGVTRKETRYICTARTRVTLGFRLYYPARRTVYDQQQYSFTRSWSREGLTPAEALKALIAKMDAIMQTSYYAGESYARKISPYFITVGRAYYKKYKHNPSMQAGTRALRLNRWDDAAFQWQKAYDTGDQKLKGRAAYNLALAAELNGQLSLAKEWTDKAFMQHGLKKALHYSNVLQNRIYDAEKLNQQLGQ